MCGPVQSRRRSHRQRAGVSITATSTLQRQQSRGSKAVALHDRPTLVSGRIEQSGVDPGNLVLANDTELKSIGYSDPIYFHFDIGELYFLAYARDARARGAS